MWLLNCCVACTVFGGELRCLISCIQFVQTELCGSPVAGEEKSEMKTTCIGSEKSLKFHRTDTQITSTELWVTWHQNEGKGKVCSGASHRQGLLCVFG